MFIFFVQVCKHPLKWMILIYASEHQFGRFPGPLKWITLIYAAEHWKVSGYMQLRCSCFC